MANQAEKNKGLFIVFEGMDGTGKTTCAKGVIGKLSPDCEICYCKGIGSKTILGRISRKYPITLLFCLDLLFITLFKIKKLLKNGNIVLQDRYNFTVENHVLASNKKIDKFLIRIFRPLLLDPDLIIFFTASPQTQIERLKLTMECNKYHRILVENPEIIILREKKYQEMLAPYKNKLNTVDTTNENEEATINRVAAIIGNAIKNRN